MKNPRAETASAAAAEGYVTGDMVAQLGYCERRLHLMYAEGRWASNVDTDEGSYAHRVVDASEDVLESTSSAGSSLRSVTLESEALGALARADRIELEGEGDIEAVPVETKKGELPPGGPYASERLQVGLQALLLRDNGYACTRGVIYYVASRSRVEVPVDSELAREVTSAMARVREVLSLRDPPLPLEDSPKCVRCSLNEICLPDEIRFLRGRELLELDREGTGPEALVPNRPRVRRLVAPSDHALPFYVQEPGAQVGKRSETLVVRKRDELLAKARLIDISQLVLCGNVGITASALHLLCEAGVPVIHMSRGYWFYGVTHGHTPRNVFDRAAQFRRSGDREFCFRVARAIVLAKGRNQRTLLRRNGPSGSPVLKEMKRALDAVLQCSDLDELRGLEGWLASQYFGTFGSLLRPPLKDGQKDLGDFNFRKRNRRPPTDPTNALLSFGYALLVKDVSVALLGAGLDPYWGIFHQARHGRPSLALDLMEEFRPVIVDSAVMTAINTGAVSHRSFQWGGRACVLTAAGRKAMLRGYALRMDQEITHPIFGYKLSWRRAIQVQAQILARVFRGEIEEYPGLTTR